MFVLKVTGEREVFFTQKRVGQKGKCFKLYKFATMLKDSPNMGTGTLTVSNDPRILPVGRFLRKTKINELPQLINVLKGDMSLIGPRPQTKRSFAAFPLSSQKQILKVKPGLSGVGSIIFRNEEEMINSKDNQEKFYDEIIMPYKAKLEEWYVNNSSVSLYFKLILITIYVVLFKRSWSVRSVLNTLPAAPKSLSKWL